jgi:cell division transport system permease protein
MNALNTAFRIIRYGTQGFRRNIWLSVIAVITMTITLLMITVFMVGDIVANKKNEEFAKKNIDYVIFVKDSASQTDVDLFRTQLNSQPQVLSLSYVSKDDARKQFDDLFGNDPDLRGIITDDNNPLPREINVRFSQASSIDSFDQFVRLDKFKAIVDKTSYQNNKQVINNYINVTNFLKILGLAFTGFFLIIAMLVILNTIRLTIYSRREEIEVMRYVGATQSYIRGPFIVEGVLFGVISALITSLIAWTVLSQLQKLITQTFNSGSTNALSDVFASTLGVGQSSVVSSLIGYLLFIQLLVGVLLGVICSYLAVRRYLKE